MSINYNYPFKVISLLTIKQTYCKSWLNLVLTIAYLKQISKSKVNLKWWIYSIFQKLLQYVSAQAWNYSELEMFGIYQPMRFYI